ncbi:MAG TPA: Gfo/Idh/MocA family oxidoreductase [Verrucomicrobiae bacterium]|nr:Gfo/Idh/MocA family oxidoreductase [Verrucomicrobiae bacterium]
MLNIALVGCGRISERHAELLGNSQIARARLAAVCDTDTSRARRLGERYGVPHYRDMHEMAAAEKDLHVISLLTPSGLHAEHVIGLAPYGKHLIVEKPMALSLDDADRMIQTCDEHGIKLFVIKQNRFNLPVQKLKEAMAAKRFGKLVLGTIRVRWCRDQAYYDQDAWRGTWAFDGGVFANQASHHIDLLEWMMGDVESVFAKSATALVDIETEDTGLAVLKFRNGALGVIEATTATRPKDLEGSLSVLGEKGTVEIGGFAVNRMKIWNFLERTPGDDEVLEKFSSNPPDVYGFGHKAYYEHVVDCILNNRKALIDGLEGRKSLELISAIYESIETGREVALRFRPQKCRLGMKQ